MAAQSFDHRRSTPEPSLDAPRAGLIELTLGTCRTNPVGRRTSALALETNAVAAFAELLVAPPGAEPWWSPHTWDGDARSSKHWQGASAVVIDIDYKDGSGTHTAPAADVAARLCHGAPDFPGNIVFPTPRGARAVFVLDTAESERTAYARAIGGAAALVATALERLGFSARDGVGGYEVDHTATDLARVFFFKGLEHELRIVRPDLYSVSELARQAPEPEESPSNIVRRPSVTHSHLEKARRQWLEDHAFDFGAPGSGACPAHPDHGDACFGRTGDRGDLWTCFSSHHPPECGQPGANGSTFFGSALDLEAYRRQCTPVEVLRADGYLAAKPREPTSRRIPKTP